MAAAYGGPVPWVLMEGLICREMHWSLDVLRKQPSQDVLLMWLALNKYDEYVASRKPQ